MTNGQWTPKTFRAAGGSADNVPGMSRTSGQRADTAQAIVQWYADLVSGTVDPSDEILVDVLADLQHLAHREGWDFDALLALARMHYHAEADWPSSKDWIQGGAST